MHCYLSARCKTVGCKGKSFLAHLEWPTDDYAVIDYPDGWFPVSVPCSLCGQTHVFEAKEIRTQTSLDPLHPPEWRPIFVFPLGKPEEVN